MNDVSKPNTLTWGLFIVPPFSWDYILNKPKHPLDTHETDWETRAPGKPVNPDLIHVGDACKKIAAKLSDTEEEVLKSIKGALSEGKLTLYRSTGEPHLSAANWNAVGWFLKVDKLNTWLQSKDFSERVKISQKSRMKPGRKPTSEEIQQSVKDAAINQYRRCIDPEKLLPNEVMRRPSFISEAFPDKPKLPKETRYAKHYGISKRAVFDIVSVAWKDRIKSVSRAENT